jgi:hypothetical protein
VKTRKWSLEEVYYWMIYSLSLSLFFPSLSPGNYEVSCFPLPFHRPIKGMEPDDHELKSLKPRMKLNLSFLNLFSQELCHSNRKLTNTEWDHL